MFIKFIVICAPADELAAKVWSIVKPPQKMKVATHFRNFHRVSSTEPQAQSYSGQAALLDPSTLKLRLRKGAIGYQVVDQPNYDFQL